MSLKSFFNGLAEKREAKRKYKALAAAIKAEDIDGVRAALAAGAKVGHLPSSGVEKMPLSLALKTGNAAIFETLLNTEDGTGSAYLWYTEFRVLKRSNDVSQTVYFTPSYLYSAIESGKEEIALILARKGGVDAERSGDVFNGGNDRWAMRDRYKDMVKKPADLARDKGMTKVVEAIEQRLKPFLAQRAAAEAQQLTEQAEQKRAEAEKLLKEAEALSPKKDQPQAPPRPSSGFHV